MQTAGANTNIITGEKEHRAMASRYLYLVMNLVDFRNATSVTIARRKPGNVLNVTTRSEYIQILQDIIHLPEPHTMETIVR